MVSDELFAPAEDVDDDNTWLEATPAQRMSEPHPNELQPQ
jgi:hypothetical protein